MKESFTISEQNQGLPPRVIIVESLDNKDKSVDRAFTSIPYENIVDPRELRPLEKNEIFEKAFNSIVGNKDLEKKVVKAMIAIRNGNATPYADFMNTISVMCLGLSDVDIENITNNFKKGILSRAQVYAQEFGLSGKELQNLQMGIWGKSDDDRMFGSSGISSFVNFLRVRKKFHESNPRVVPAFYFENYLDAKFGVDLIEVIDSDGGAVLNLIQIKSKQYTEGTEIYHKKHKDWVTLNMIDLDAYENTLSKEPSDGESLRIFISNIDKLEEVFLDIFSGEQVVSKELLFEKLGIGNNRPKVEQVWILQNYLPFLKEEVLKLKEEGYIDELTMSHIESVIADIEKQVENVKNQKRDLRGIKEIYSICTVGEREVSKVKVFDSGGYNSKQKAMKIGRVN